MKITLKLFAAFRETIGQEELCLEVPESSTIGDVYEKLLQNYSHLAMWRSQLRYARNLEFVEATTVLAEGDEVAFIPPVSGG